MISSNPFRFGTPVSGPGFTGQNNLIRTLGDRMLASRSFLILSHSGWGKSSLTEELFNRSPLGQHEYQLCRVDLRPGDGKDELVHKLECAVCELYSLRSTNIELPFADGWEIMDRLEIIGALNDTRLFIVIRGFHYLNGEKEMHEFLTRLERSSMRGNHCCYILHASLMRLSIGPYKGLRAFILPPLTQGECTTLVQLLFRRSGKVIRAGEANAIARISNGIPHFLQLLSWNCWEQCVRICSSQTIRKASNGLCRQFAPYFQQQFDQLTLNQKNCLLALCLPLKAPYSESTIREFKLKGKPHVSRALQGLEQKEIITTRFGGYIFLNPLLPQWLTGEDTCLFPDESDDF